MLRIGIVAGEQSGDLLGAGLVQALRSLHPSVQFVGVGGRRMQAAGVELLYSVEQLGVVGLVEVLRHFFRLRDVRNSVLRHFTRQPPDIFIGVDAPDFNLWLERRLRSQGCRTVHFVSPKVWAWRAYRLRAMRVSTDLTLGVFPFEEPFYRRAGLRMEYVGHPLADVLPTRPQPAPARRRLGLAEQGLLIGLLPGSRRAEIERIAPVFLETARELTEQLPGARFACALPSDALKQRMEALRQKIAPQLCLPIYLGQSHCLMEASDLLLLATGTASLEAMLLQKPMLVAYRMNPLTVSLLRLMTKLAWMSLPNILAQESLVPEFLQGRCVAPKLSEGVQQLLADPEGLQALKQRFQVLGERLRRDANRRAAQAVLRLHADG